LYLPLRLENDQGFPKQNANACRTVAGLDSPSDGDFLCHRMGKHLMRRQCRSFRAARLGSNPGCGRRWLCIAPLAPVDTAFALTVTNATLSFPSQSAVTFTAATDLPVTSPELSSAAATELFSLDQRTGLPRR